MPKKIEKIKITRKKDSGGGSGSPIIQSPPPEPIPQEPAHEEPIPQEPTPKEPTPQEPTPEKPISQDPLPEKIEEKLLALLESMDEEYLVEFMYNFLLNIKERENEIEKGDPVLWTLIIELKEMIDL